MFQKALNLVLSTDNLSDDDPTELTVQLHSFQGMNTFKFLKCNQLAQLECLHQLADDAIDIVPHTPTHF